MNQSKVLLAVNCGSSSVKIAIFDPALRRLGDAEASRIATSQTVLIRYSGFGGLYEEELSPGASHAHAIAQLGEQVSDHFGSAILGVGHRVVHGGATFSEPIRIDPAAMAEIEALATLAPLHQPHNLTGIRLFGARFEQATQVACFDTAFHRTIPEHRQLYGLPAHYGERGLRAYGFHGLSCTHTVKRFEAITGRALPARMVICHLGNGASVTGVEDGQSRYNSMGFTPIDGLIMGQRAGHLDPGAVLWLVEDMKGDIGAVSTLLNRESGLLGISGESPDMRNLLASTSPAAARAIDMFVDRVVKEVAAAAAAVGGLDALVFTGGIGSNSVVIRARVLAALSWLGFTLDVGANEKARATITTPSSPRSAHVIQADEELVIARAVSALC